MTSETLRTATAAGCILGGIAIHYSGAVPLPLGVFIWLLLAGGAGFMRPTGWLLVAAPLPWLIGVGGGVLIGQHESFGEAWLLPLLLSTVAGVFGTIFGVTARKGTTASSRERNVD